MGNVNRKKGKRHLTLWKKKQKALDKEVAKENLEIVETVNQGNNKNWIEKVNRANGMREEGK